MQCQFCGDTIEMTRRKKGNFIFGIARCKCSNYPILKDIVILKKDKKTRILIDMIKNGYPEGAASFALTTLRTLLYNFPYSIRILFVYILTVILGRREFIYKIWQSLFYTNFKELQHCNLGLTSSCIKRIGLPHSFYYLNRFSYQTFDTTLPLLFISPETGTILDLGSGAGHFSLLGLACNPNAHYVLADGNFALLVVASSILHKYLERTFLLCLDAENPLPFNDHTFDTIIASDMFHALRNQETVAKELLRLKKPEGVITIPHCHNKNNGKTFGKTRGFPLDETDLRSMFSPMDCKILLERMVLREIRELDSLTTTFQSMASRPQNSEFFVIVNLPDFNIYNIKQRLFDIINGDDRISLSFPSVYKIHKISADTFRLKTRNVRNEHAMFINVDNDLDYGNNLMLTRTTLSKLKQNLTSQEALLLFKQQVLVPKPDSYYD